MCEMSYSYSLFVTSVTAHLWHQLQLHHLWVTAAWTISDRFMLTCTYTGLIFEWKPRVITCTRASHKCGYCELKSYSGWRPLQLLLKGSDSNLQMVVGFTPYPAWLPTIMLDVFMSAKYILAYSVQHFK